MTLLEAILRALRVPQKPRTIRGGKAPPRNKPCPCGSGVKFKKCCGAPRPPKAETEEQRLRRLSEPMLKIIRKLHNRRNP